MSAPRIPRGGLPPMYDRTLTTDTHTRITVETAGSRRTVDLYSPEGLRTVASMWVKLGA